MITILLIIFTNAPVDSVQVEFENRTACIEARRQLLDDRILAKVYCLPKRIDGLGELDD